MFAASSRLSLCSVAALATVLLLSPSRARAQETGAAAAPDPGSTLDPASPLDQLPDLGVAWPDMSAPDAAPQSAAAQSGGTVDVAAERRYRVVLEGLEGVADAQFRGRFNALSVLVQGEGKSANTAQIDRRAREDEALMRDLLRAYGYYDASVDTRVDPNGEGSRITVALEVIPGPLYHFAEIALPGLAAAGEKEAKLRAAFAVQPGDSVNAEKVAAAQINLKSELGHEGFAFAKVGEPDIVLDHEARTARMTLAVEPDGARRFGELRIEGKRLFGLKHLRRIARFKAGDPYDSARIEDFRRALIATGLVSSVELRPSPSGQGESVDVAVKLEPAPVRTIAGELGYGSGEGVRAEVSWQHRNLIRPEGAVTFRGVAGTREQSLGATLRRNNYKDRDRVLTGQIVASHSNLSAYDARTFTLAAGLERQSNIIWQKKWTWSLGGELVASDERDKIVATGLARRRTYFIAALPTTLAYDGSDDLLNPTRGFRLSGRFSPEASFQGGAFGYARAQIDSSAYAPVSDRIVIAGRLRFGSILGATRDRIAPSRRFYSGGGGSVRGYGYQAIGPVDVNGDPVGGRSLAEFSIESRVRFGDFGVVPFLDAGNLYTSTVPKMTGLRYGAGLGARYYTSFGPIRFDVGTPINPRPGDARVTVYVSLGQAF